MFRFTARPQLAIPLGIEGENRTHEVLFPLSRWKEALGEGRVQLLVWRPGDETAYPAALTMEGSCAVWTITQADVAKPGFGKAQLNYYTADGLAKSETYKTTISADPMPVKGETPPDPAKSWVEQVLQAAGDVKEINEHPPIPGEEGFWLIWDAEQDNYVTSDTPLPSGGGGGGSANAVLYTPQTLTEGQQTQARENVGAAPKRLIIAAQQSGSEMTFTASNTAQEATEHLLNGGSVGLQLLLSDGSPLASLNALAVLPDGMTFATPSENAMVVAYLVGNLVTVSFVSLSGQQGPPGEQGPEGPPGEQGPEGPAGADGHTPEKGVDYWTEEDKAQIVDEVLAALPAAEGVGF